jgi:hypothetical protein
MQHASGLAVRARLAAEHLDLRVYRADRIATWSPIAAALRAVITLTLAVARSAGRPHLRVTDRPASCIFMRCGPRRTLPLLPPTERSVGAVWGDRPAPVGAAIHLGGRVIRPSFVREFCRHQAVVDAMHRRSPARPIRPGCKRCEHPRDHGLRARSRIMRRRWAGRRRQRPIYPGAAALRQIRHPPPLHLPAPHPRRRAPRRLQLRCHGKHASRRSPRRPRRSSRCPQQRAPR